MPKAVAEAHDGYLTAFCSRALAFKETTRSGMTGVTKLGKLITISLSLCLLSNAGEPLVSALIQEEKSHSFSLTADAQGLIIR